MPEGINVMSANEEYEEIDMVVDSGATETVVSDEMLLSIETVEGWCSKHGVKYEVADGTMIPNRWENMCVAIG